MKDKNKKRGGRGNRQIEGTRRRIKGEVKDREEKKRKVGELKGLARGLKGSRCMGEKGEKKEGAPKRG